MFFSTRLRRTWIILLGAAALSILAALGPGIAHAQDSRCGVARDFMLQGLEQVKTGTPDEVENGLQLLKHSVEVCASYGDGWYYRSVFEQKLGQTAKASYSLSKAKMFGSQAMDEGANPFRLAAPVPLSIGGLVKKPLTLPPLRQKWALVVGISQFQDSSLNLRYTSKDANDLSHVLTDPKYGRFDSANVHVLADAQITMRKLKEELNWLSRMAGEDDLVVIFLATHGTSRSDDNADVNYIVTSDTDRQSQDSMFGSAMGMAELSDIVRTRIKARRTVILLDTCHSAGATAALKDRASGADFSPSPASLERIRQGVGRAILTSSQEKEVSFEGAPFENGYFTHFLIEALHENNGMDTIEQLYTYVKEKLPQAVATRSQASRGVRVNSGAAATSPEQTTQTPVLSSSQLGEGIVLGAPASSGRAIGSPGAN